MYGGPKVSGLNLSGVAKLYMMISLFWGQIDLTYDTNTKVLLFCIVLTLKIHLCNSLIIAKIFFHMLWQYSNNIENSIFAIMLQYFQQYIGYIVQY